MLALLQRVEPDENMDRWYLVTVQPSLLDDIAVVVAYGSRHTDWQQVRVMPAQSLSDAHHIAQNIIAGKLKKGYVYCQDSWQQ